MIEWSPARLNEIRLRSLDPGLDRTEARLAVAELAAAEDHIVQAQSIVAAEFEPFRLASFKPERLYIPFLRACFVTQRLDFVTTLLVERHQPGCRLDLEIDHNSRFGATILIEFALPERMRLIFDGSILKNDKTDVEVLWTEWIFPVFAHYARNWPGDNGIVLFSNWDDARSAGLAMCANRPDCFLIPDNIFVHLRGYRDFREIADKCAIPWSQRCSVAFWRGSTTGQPFEPQKGWRSLPRLRLCEISREHPDAIDAGISGVIQIGDPGAEAEIRAAGYMRPRVPPTEFNNYKYQIDIDGNTNAWPGLFQKLLGGNPVLKVASHLGYRQWYYDRLLPWVNYVPVAADMSDLLEKVNWLRDHDTAARRIGERGRALALSMDYEGELRQSVRTISAALRYFSGRPEFEWRPTGRDLNTSVCVDGWDLSSGEVAIALGSESTIRLPRPVCRADFLLSLDLSCTVKVPGRRGQRISVVVNGEVLRHDEVSTRQIINLTVPGSVMAQGDELVLRVLHPDAMPGASAENPLDDRRLSIGLHALTLTAAGTAPPETTRPASSVSRRVSRYESRIALGLAIDDAPGDAIGFLRTHHGTILYVDAELGILRHGQRAGVPKNLRAVARGRTVYLIYDRSDGERNTVSLRPAAMVDADYMHFQQPPGPRHGMTVVGFDSAGNTFGLAQLGFFLCADPTGAVTLSRREMSLWEQFQLVR